MRLALLCQEENVIILASDYNTTVLLLSCATMEENEEKNDRLRSCENPRNIILMFILPSVLPSDPNCVYLQ